MKQVTHRKILEKEKLKKNNIATIIKTIGFIMIISGFISGIVLGQETISYTHYDLTYTEFNWYTALIYWGSGLLSGIIFIGFGEIIYLLQNILASFLDNQVN